MEQPTDVTTTENAHHSLWLKNARSQPASFFVEPWGEVYAMPPDATFLIMSDRPIRDTILIEYTDEGMMIWASVPIQIFHDGSEIGGENGPRQQPPAVPKK